MCGRDITVSVKLSNAYLLLKPYNHSSTMPSFSKQITVLKPKWCISSAILKTLVCKYSSNLHRHLLIQSPATLQNINLSQKSKYTKSAWKINPHMGCCYQSSLSKKDEPIDDELFSKLLNEIEHHSPIDDELFSKLLNEIEHHSPTSTRQICVDYFSKLIREKNLQASYKLLQIMRTRNIFLDINTFIIPLLEAAGEENDVDLISQLFKDAAVSSNGALPLIPYHRFVKALRNGNDSSLLFKFVKHVSEFFTFPCSRTLAVNRIISALAEIGQIDKALLIFDQMKSMFLKCRPDLYTYDTVLEMLGRVGRVDEMVKVFGLMKEANLVPDIYTYNTLLNSFRKVGRLDLCLAFAKEMEQKGIEPDLCTFTALIEIFGRTGNVEKSLLLFETMKDKKIRPSIYIYRSLINSLKKMGKLDRAVKLQEEMRISMPDLVTPQEFQIEI